MDRCWRRHAGVLGRVQVCASEVLARDDARLGPPLLDHCVRYVRRIRELVVRHWPPSLPLQDRLSAMSAAMLVPDLGLALCEPVGNKQ